MASHLPFQKQADYLPASRLGKIRDRRVRSLVNHAAKYVPYYRELFHEHGIDPRAIRTAADLEMLPLLDKQTVRDNPRAFVSTSRRGQTAIPFKTSGSTGMPLTIYHDRRSLLANMARTWPEKAIIRKVLGNNRAGRQATILYPSSTVRRIWELYREYSFVPGPSRQLLLDVNDPFDEIIKAINTFKPDIVSGYGSYLETLFRMVDARQTAVHLPRVLTYGADNMTEGGRQLIENKLGIRVFSRYNSVESFRIGFTCEQHHGFHIREDLCCLRVVDAHGNTPGDGEPGEVVISNLVNRGTVLINYRIGDLGVITQKPCPCGRTLPMLASLEGRSEDIIYLADGRMVHPRIIWNVFKGRNDLLQYQLIQHKPDSFELKIVLAGSPGHDAATRDILTDLGKLLGDVEITVSCHESLSVGNRKFRPVISRCSPTLMS
ncbi:phenylacetate-CoA ligase [Thiogranum longum]|uniref:Phenylacetate-CoA ligase n=1 Tax=Thiogranum longum TaxID=1537524 RepID=A0A4R1HE87_9GAMM|nr:phenylacetate--CoA ligase family protein [Thiogranum longum]TCK19041.1 phenylacetate-CoA ligase [Thiogranum longum]